MGAHGVTTILDTLPAAPDGPSVLELRQRERMGEIAQLYATRYERLACELALGMDDPESVFAAYQIDPDAAADLLEHPQFLAILQRVGTEIRENGLSFRQKARAQADDLLAHSYEIATDPHASAAVRADLIKWTAKMAGHEPPPPKDVGASSAGGLTLNITFAGQEPQRVIGQEPLTITQGEA